MAGRPMGGLARLLINFSDNFMVVSLNTGNKTITLVNVYIRSNLRDSGSMNDYLATIYDIQSFFNDKNLFMWRF